MKNIKTKNIVKKTLFFSLLLTATLALAVPALADCPDSATPFRSQIVTYFQLPDLPDTVTDSRCSYVINNAGQRVCRIRMRGVIHYPNSNQPSTKYPAIMFNHGSEKEFGPAAIELGCPIANYFVPKGYAVFLPFRRGHSDGNGLATGSTGRHIEDSINDVFNGTPDPRDPAPDNDPQCPSGPSCYRVQLLNLQTDEDVVAGFTYLKGRPDIKSFTANNQTEWAVAIGGSSYGGRVTVLANQYELGHQAALVFSPGAEGWGPVDGTSPIREALMDAAGHAKTPAFYLQARWDYDTRPTIDLAYRHAYGSPDPKHSRGWNAAIFPYQYPCATSDPRSCTDDDYQSVHAGFTRNAALWGPSVLNFLRRNGVK